MGVVEGETNPAAPGLAGSPVGPPAWPKNSCEVQEVWLIWGLDMPLSSPLPPVLKAWEQAAGGTQVVYSGATYWEEG